MPSHDALSVLKQVFGYSAFRDQQLDIITDVCDGQNVLAIMPTGAGKSLCFQVPALMMDGLTIVVSPLISLMQNQVKSLQLLGVEAASLTSATSEDENDLIWQKIRDKTLKLLYVSPERLMTPGMLEVIERLDISLFAIDEAHCISQWGAAFRPEYEALSALQSRFPNVPIIALTATADQATRGQIIEKIFSGNVKTYLSGFDRPNITLNVEIKNNWKRQLLQFLKGRKDQYGPENGIVYCLSRKKTEEISAYLVEQGYHALPYHAGMSDHQRQENLNRFMSEEGLVIVATIAFGMGIDKPDIRFVFHADLPSSPEAYYQEIGRAGRDGQPAVAYMLYGMQDIAMRRMFIENEPSSDDHKRREHQRLNALLVYCESPTCRRNALLKYFGDDQAEQGCGNCDICFSPRETIDATTAGRKFLSAIARTGESFGVGHITNILTGKITEKISQRNHDLLPTFGVGQEFSLNEWKSIARQLMAHGFIHADVEFGSLKITPKGRELLKGNTTFNYRPDVLHKQKAPGSSKRNTAIADDLSSSEMELFQSLKVLRKELAQERSVPAYIIFSDKSLKHMATARPIDLDQFSHIHGVGEKKINEFGATFTTFIKDHQPE